MSAWDRLTNKLSIFSKPKVGPIGLDIRSHSLNMVQVVIDKKSLKPRVHVAVSLPLPCSSAELFASPALFKKTICGALKLHPFIGKRCVTTLPANKVRLKHISFEQQAKQSDMQAMLPRLQELLGNKLESSVIDYIPIRPEHEKQLSRSAIIAITERTDMNAYLGLLDSCQIDVDAVEIGPLAIRRLIAAMNPEQQQAKVMTMNVGRQKSYLTVIWGRRILLDREVAFGLDNVVNVVAAELDITEQDASDLLDKYGFELPGNPDRAVDIDSDQKDMTRMLNDIVMPLFTTLASRIRDVLLYTASETRGGGIDVIYLLGSITHWHGIDARLQQILSMPVQVIDPLYGFEWKNNPQTPSEKHDDMSSIAVATGMALRGVITNV